MCIKRKKKVCFFVDGFNFYHSLIDASIIIKKKTDKDICLKWFDLYAFLKSYLKKNEKLSCIYYFTAFFPYKIKDGVFIEHHERRVKHRTYIKVLEDMGIKVVLGKFFIKKNNKCPYCSKTLHKAEEKKTDVSIGVTMLKEAIKNSYDICYLVSGDTDFVPAIESINEIYKNKKIGIIFPYDRQNNELKNIATAECFNIRPEILEKYILDNPYITESGIEIHCPESWLNK